METARRCMHSDGRGGERVIRREYESAPVLTIVIGCCWRTSYDIMPSENRVSCDVHVETRAVGTYSRMFDSEGWAMMYGGGFSAMVLYSRVNYGYSELYSRMWHTRQLTLLFAARLAMVTVPRLKE